PRELLGRFFGLFRIVSLVVGCLFNYFLFGYAEKNHAVVFGTLALVYAVGISLLCCFVREGEYPPPPAQEPGKSNWQTGFEYLGRCASSPYYWLLFSMLIVNGLVWLPSGVFIAFYAKKLQIDMDYFGKLGAYSYVISMVLAYPLGAWVDRFHPLRCVMVTIGIYSITTLLSGFFICDQRTFAIAMVTQSVVAGIYWTTSASLTMRLFPRSQFAQYGIVGGFLSGTVNFFAVPLLGLYLDASGHAYEHTFFIASALSFVALGLMFWYYRYFNAYGGVKNYVAPEF
ncbi:MAG: MFS transporter, partial [Victivallaceae bacterium]